jgi:carbon starvation protein
MLAEGFVAFIALVTVMIATSDDLLGPDGKNLSAGKIYGNGIGNFLTLLIGKDNLQFAITFGAMAFSTFVFDTLDVTMRLGRYLVQELLNIPSRLGALAGTLVTVAVPFILIFFAKPGSYVEFWTLFGASNQLLAALTLLSITAWLYKARRRIAFTFIPMLFVLTITLWALASMVYANLRAAAGVDIKLINGIASLALIALAIFLVVTAWIKSRTLETAEPPADVL